MQLFARLDDPGAVLRVDDKDEALGAGVVVPPEGSDLVLAADVLRARGQAGVFVFSVQFSSVGRGGGARGRRDRLTQTLNLVSGESTEFGSCSPWGFRWADRREENSLYVLVGDGFDVEPDGRDGGDGLVQLEFVQDGCVCESTSQGGEEAAAKVKATSLTGFACCVQSEHEDPHFLVAKDLACNARNVGLSERES